MNILPIPTTRVSTLQQSGQASTSITSAEAQVNTIAQELSTGVAVTQASDNPAAAVVIQQLQQQLSDSDQYGKNITAAQDQLNNVDATLGSLSTLLTQASSTAASNVSTTTDAAERASAAETIDSIYNQVLSTATLKYGGQYVFGTDDAANPPYVATATGVEYTASDDTLASQTDTSMTLSYQVTGQSVFGGASASISAGTDLTPAASATTRLVDLNGARNNGVNLGTIDVSNGTTTAAVDLTDASTVQDVADAINAAAVPGVTASVGTDGLNVAAGPAADVTVADTDGGTAAADLGILRTAPAGVGVAIAGTNLNARLTDLTPLASLRGGAGIDPAGFTVSNGSTAQTIGLGGLTTVQDLVNAVNTAGLGVRAAIRSDGSGIDLTNNTQGAAVTVSEAGGQTAAELGFNTFKPTTLLSSLNKGNGVSTPAGDQFTLTTADGSVVNVGLTQTPVTTVADVAAQINAAAGGKVTASLATGGGGLVLTDHTAGAGALAVTPVNAATTAADLGLTAATTAGGTLTGADVNPVVTPGLLTDLNDLRVALRANDTAGIGQAADALQDDSQSVATVRGVVGARVQELDSRATTLTTQNTSTQALLSSYRDVDYATTVTQYQTLQTSLQASLQVTAKTLSLSLMDYLD